MHSFSRLNKLVVPVCVLIICVTVASGRTKKASQKSSTGKATVTSSAKSKTAVSSKAKSTKRTSARSTSKHSKKGSNGTSRRVSRPRGQQAIASDRVREIQEALIRANYLDGEASGEWDDSTRQALTKFQSDNGWQSKVVPDSRALIKLGLGPNHDNVINPETSLISRPPAADPANRLANGGGVTRR